MNKTELIAAVAEKPIFPRKMQKQRFPLFSTLLPTSSLRAAKFS